MGKSLRYESQPDGTWKETVEEIDPNDPLVRKAEELSAANGGKPVVGWCNKPEVEGIDLLENL